MIKIGDSQSFSKTITETDILIHAGITRNLNPIHINEMAARQSSFGGRNSHGMLLAGYITTVLGTKLPGKGTIYLSQNLRFLKPSRIGETVTASCTVEDVINAEKGIYRFATKCVNEIDEILVDGEAVVKYREHHAVKASVHDAACYIDSMESVKYNYSFYSSSELVSLGIASYMIIGTASVVLPGVDIGIGCSLGDMTMVLKDCEPWGIHVGSPAKRIKERSMKLIELEKQLREESGIFRRSGGLIQSKLYYSKGSSIGTQMGACAA